MTDGDVRTLAISAILVLTFLIIIRSRSIWNVNELICRNYIFLLRDNYFEGGILKLTTYLAV